MRAKRHNSVIRRRLALPLATLAVLLGLLVGAGKAGAASANPGAPAGPSATRSPDSGPAVHHDTSPPLRTIPPTRHPPGQRVIPVRPLPRPSGPAGPDGASQPAAFPSPQVPSTSLNFDGIGAGFSGPQGTFTVQAAPPDTNGAVGPNNYVQIVNTDFAVFNKSGTVLYGPVAINTLWSGFGGNCQSDNDGDPIVRYDQISDRWIITQLAVTNPNPNYLECIAVSQTGDPTGAYNRYSFAYANFDDYPKLSVWPDAYYITYNMFTSSTGPLVGGEVCALNRGTMLVGQQATQQCFNEGTSYSGLLAADLDGAQLPPTGSPEYVLALGASANQLAFWKFHVDWTTPANTTLDGTHNSDHGSIQRRLQRRHVHPTGGHQATARLARRPADGPPCLP